MGAHAHATPLVGAVRTAETAAAAAAAAEGQAAAGPESVTPRDLSPADLAVAREARLTPRAWVHNHAARHLGDMGLQPGSTGLQPAWVGLQTGCEVLQPVDV